MPIKRVKCSRCKGHGWIRDRFAIALAGGLPILFDKIGTALGFDEDEEFTRETCNKCDGRGYICKTVTGWET